MPKRKRGRPVGITGEHSLVPTKKLRKWRPKHTMMVHLSALGHTNIEIARHFDISPASVSYVLNTPQAHQLFADYQKTLHERLGKDIEDKIVSLTKTGVEKLAETVEAEFVLGTDAKKHQDNIVLTLIKGRGYLAGDVGENGQIKNPITEKLASRLVAALEKSNEADEIRRLSRGDDDRTVIEADVEIEDEYEDVEDADDDSIQQRKIS